MPPASTRSEEDLVQGSQELWGHPRETPTFLAFKLLAVFNLFGGKDNDPRECLSLPFSPPLGTHHIWSTEGPTSDFVYYVAVIKESKDDK